MSEYIVVCIKNNKDLWILRRLLQIKAVAAILIIIPTSDKSKIGLPRKQHFQAPFYGAW